MRKSYIKQVNEEDIFGEGVCHICGHKGYHSVCDEKEIMIQKKFREAEVKCLKEYAIHGSYGVKESSKDSYEVALSILEGFLAQEPNFEQSHVVEGNTWWFFPNSWIGIIGFIIEKDTNLIYPLGSGLGANQDKDEYLIGSWAAIRMYVNGKVEHKTGNT